MKQSPLRFGKTFRFFLYQLTVCLLLVLTWTLVVFHLNTSPYSARASAATIATMMFILWIVFALNYYLLVRPLLHSNRHQWLKKICFVALNILILLFLSRGVLFFSLQDLPEEAKIGVYTFRVTWVLLNLAMVGLAIGRRYYEQQQITKEQLREERERNTEAELAWLKNQLNPHFLFNTLNNISSLTQIDASMAQEKIAQLSDLMRYALYETHTTLVTLQNELAFMRNYISLMSIRCGENVDIKVRLHPIAPADSDATIPPMLLIAPIENAFKHGISGNQGSFVHIDFEYRQGRLVFVCENSNFAKPDTNRSGSGIGLDNLRRRLQLLYPDRHTLEIQADETVYWLRLEIS